MKLFVLSNMIQKGVGIIPRLLVALFIFGVGWLIARPVALTVRRALYREGVPKAALIARFSSGVIMLFFSAMALTELDIAREVVIIGFSVVILTLAAVIIILISIGGRELVKKTLDSLDEKQTGLHAD
jgi:drug/metabolite transporter (DMT)-like permease